MLIGAGVCETQVKSGKCLMGINDLLLRSVEMDPLSYSSIIFIVVLSSIKKRQVLGPNLLGPTL